MQITAEDIDKAINYFAYTVTQFLQNTCFLCKKIGLVNCYYIQASLNKDYSIIIGCCKTCNPKDLYPVNSVFKLSTKDIFYIKCK